MILDETKITKLEGLLKKPKTVDLLAMNLKVHRRTIYRWLEILEERGKRVVASRARPTTYQLAS